MVILLNAGNKLEEVMDKTLKREVGKQDNYVIFDFTKTRRFPYKLLLHFKTFQYNIVRINLDLNSRETRQADIVVILKHVANETYSEQLM